MSEQRRLVKNIAEYLEQVSKIKKDWPDSVLAFRGQECEHWGLESSAERRLKKSMNSNPASQDKVVPDQLFIKYHQERLERCKLKDYDKREGKSLSELELLAHLQHHGAATCLIDFTRDALVALWFACEKAESTESKDSKGKVFITNTADNLTFLEIAPDDINKPMENILRFEIRKKSDSQATSPRKGKDPKAIMREASLWHWIPAHLNERIMAQHSLFLFGLPSASGKLPAEEIIIELGSKDQIRQELKAIHDIHEESLFPDFTGFAYTQRHDAPYAIPDAEKYLRSGIEAHQRGDLDQAIQDYSKVIELKPDSVEAYYNRGNAYFIKGDLDQAIKDYDKAIECKDDFAEAYNNRGLVYMQQGNPDQAILDYSKAIKLKKDDVVAYNNRGTAYAAQGDLGRAIQDYTQAIKLNPDNPVAYSNRGLAYQRKGNLDKALEDYNMAIDLNPDDAFAYSNRGFIYAEQGDTKRAIRDYSKTIELYPNYAAAYFNRGLAYTKQGDPGDFDRAIQDFNQAIALEPDFVKAYYNRGLAYFNKGDFDQAIRNYSKAIELKPDYAEIYCSRGLAYFNKNDLDQAIQDFNQAVKIKPDCAEAYCSRAMVYADQENFDRAIQDFNQAISLKPDFAIAICRRGIVYLCKKEWNQARADFTAARKMGLDLPQVFAESCGSVSKFEKLFAPLPEDIRKMLTPKER